MRGCLPVLMALLLTLSGVSLAERRFQRVDVLLPRSGDLGELGEEFLRGFLLSIKGDFEVRIWETEASPRRTRTIVEEVVERESALMVGPLTSPVVEAVIPLHSARMASCVDSRPAAYF